jgi:hypothetical protein
MSRIMVDVDTVHAVLSPVTSVKVCYLGLGQRVRHKRRIEETSALDLLPMSCRFCLCLLACLHEGRLRDVHSVENW